MEKTPWDYGDKQLTLKELEGILKRYEINKGFKVKNIYGLTPMQEGMLFHALMDRESSAYFEQTVLTLKGDLRLDIFDESFKKLVDRYDILRTVFVYEGVEKPRQVVLRDRETKVYYEDLTNIGEQGESTQIESLVQAYAEKDRNKGFDLNEDVLIRISLLKTACDEYKVIWSFHHILMDGWCNGIIINDFFKIYSSRLKGRSLDLPETHSYMNYIEWLEKRDKEEAEEYWVNYLKDYENQAIVPKKIKISADSKDCSEGKYEEKTFIIKES